MITLGRFGNQAPMMANNQTLLAGDEQPPEPGNGLAEVVNALWVLAVAVVAVLILKEGKR